MAKDIDFQALFSGMAASGDSNPIQAIHNILPTYDNVQMQLRFQAEYYINKYDLEDAREVFREIDKIMGQNKNLTMLQSKNMQALLAAYTQTELIRGIKVQAINNTSSGEVSE